MTLFLQLFIVALKIIVPAGMLLFPFQAVWANYILDVVDGDILLSLGMEEQTYQTIDKLADYVSYNEYSSQQAARYHKSRLSWSL